MTTKQEAAEAAAKEALLVAVKRYEDMVSGAAYMLRLWEKDPVPETLNKILAEIASSRRAYTEEEIKRADAFLDGLDTAADVALIAYSYAFVNHKEEQA